MADQRCQVCPAFDQSLGCVLASLRQYGGENAMKSTYKVPVALLVGGALGAFAVQGLYAQGKPPAYAVVIIDEVTDPASWQAVTGRPNSGVADLLKPFGGRQIARTGEINSLDGGKPPSRVVITRFDSAEKARSWYNAPDQQKINDTRMKATKSRSFVVQGM
jgi:uncharacterized protein (DUF1330 family)